jgi:hypothetical protein
VLEAPRDAHWVNYALSADGTTIAANAGGHYYRWTAADGYTDLGPGHALASTVGISADGQAVCGTIVDADGHRRPAIWRASDGWQALPAVTGSRAVDGSLGSGYDPDRQGSAAVGLAWTDAGAVAFHWTASSGSRILPHSGHGSRATDLADRVDVAVGFDEDPRTGQRRPARWSAGTLELVAGPAQYGEVLAVSSDGDRCCGQLDGRAFYLDDTLGLVDLGVLGGSAWDHSLAADISDAGAVVGWSGDTTWGALDAFVWTPSAGLRPLARWFADLGIEVPADLHLTGALEISADGSTILGTWQDARWNQGNWLVTGLDAGSYAALPVSPSRPDTSWQSVKERSVWPPPPSAPGRPIRMR